VGTPTTEETPETGGHNSSSREVNNSRDASNSRAHRKKPDRDSRKTYGSNNFGNTRANSSSRGLKNIKAS
jgi:hypothetical protein